LRTLEPARLADFEALGRLAGLRADPRYAGRDNVLGRRVPGALDGLLLHPLAAAKLRAALRILRARRPGLRLLAYDGLRRVKAQKALWALVEGTDQERYVADPAKGSMHNLGLALDCSLCDARGRELDMGTGFDAFTPLAQPRLEARFVKSGRLSRGALRNRLALRDVMQRAGWIQRHDEWWHYDALAPKEAFGRYPALP
jgi:D-alanyl-D-alanine dipeptidase